MRWFKSRKQPQSQRIETTIGANYTDWGLTAGLREFVQNALDARDEGYPTSIKAEDPRRIRITTLGTTLSKESLLLGQTSKAQRANARGKFGEGYKIGALALLRGGCSVTIRTGDEIWTPSIARSSTFDADVLVFDIEKATDGQDPNRVEVYIYRDQPIGGLLSEVTCYDKPVLCSNVYGDILQRQCNVALYARDLRFETYSNWYFSYNLRDIPLDRDRGNASFTAAATCAARLLLQAYIDRGITTAELLWASTDRYVDMFMTDVTPIDDETAKAVLDRLGEELNTTGAENVLFVAEGEHAENAARQAGLVPIAIPRRLFAVIRQVAPGINDTLSAIHEDRRPMTGTALSFDQRAVLEKAIELTKQVVVAPVVLVEDQYGISGAADLDKLQIMISPTGLTSLTEAISTLVHEQAHLNTRASDADPAHKQEIERLFSTLLLAKA